MSVPVKSSAPLLIIGYGNTLRQDDQAGPVVAELVGAEDLPGVKAVACPQLWPEHAEAVSHAREVVFVDAQAGSAQRARLRRIEPGESSQVTTHAAGPRTLLALSRDVYGRVPPGWLLTIPAEKFGFGTGMSRLTSRGIQAAVRRVVKMARKKRTKAGKTTKPHS